MWCGCGGVGVSDLGLKVRQGRWTPMGGEVLRKQRNNVHMLVIFICACCLSCAFVVFVRL